jgi:hypothetical protein
MSLNAEEVVGTGSVVAATPGMQYPDASTLPVKNMWARLAASRMIVRPAAQHARQRLLVDPGLAATFRRHEVPVVLAGSFVSRALTGGYSAWAAALRAFVEATAQAWEEANFGRSALGRALSQPAYGALRMAQPISIETALRRLDGNSRPLWLAFLQNATGERPAAGTHGIDEAAAAWKEWGIAQGYIP